MQTPADRRQIDLETKIEFLKGVGPQKAALLQTELGIFTFGDLLLYFPFRHEDRSRFYAVSEIHDQLPYVQVRGTLRSMEVVGEGPKKRLNATLYDGTAALDLVWFQGINWIQKRLKTGQEYVVFGKPQAFGGRYSLSHPEVETVAENAERPGGGFEPVYQTTEKLKARYMDSRALARLVRTLLEQIAHKIPETLPDELLRAHGLIGRAEAITQAHFPDSPAHLTQAVQRLKFEELFLIQLRLLSQKQQHRQKTAAQAFVQIPSFNRFFREHLPFELTNAQKRVIREIYNDLKTGFQMNRLVQGDVGSGKTIVAFCCMLMVIDGQAQACLMAPTEILAEQHHTSLKPLAQTMGLQIACLTGSTRKSDRKEIESRLREGSLHIIIGTHALLEDRVEFQNLGLCVIDEQHRFGVAQRARLWGKNSVQAPHILVMTATPIPRTLAMTVYGDLDTSVIDELPKGRKPIQTEHRTDAHRLRVWGFVREQVKLGRQVYIVYPLIEESEKLDYKNLMDGYESVLRAFDEMAVSIVHGQMKPQDKDFEMQRFVRGETQIMVATTVIEVGVNVPNASVMIIENAEKFGLSQLHQLRGRVGRGAEQSYCILMTGQKVSKEAKVRIEAMCRTNNGFEIADIDLKLRGPGDLMGTQQSGVLNLKFADLSQDQELIRLVRQIATEIVEADPELRTPQYQVLRQTLDSQRQRQTEWSKVS